MKENIFAPVTVDNNTSSPDAKTVLVLQLLVVVVPFVDTDFNSDGLNS